MASHNRTLRLTDADITRLQPQFLRVDQTTSVADVENRVLCQDFFDALPHLPTGFVDLLFIDPPYNLNKTFNSHRFNERSNDAYRDYVASWLEPLLPLLKPDASVYVCSDWRSSTAVYDVCSQHLQVRNRITWEREKGRGAKRNWKNASEDIWYCTNSNSYYFDVDAVKLQRRVIAPYREQGQPKDWQKTAKGNFRMTHPSNIWTDLTVPFWSMPENTDHPTQKPEKLVAKVILASCPPEGIILDPFAGSGTTAVVAHKLGRRFMAIEQDPHYCCLALRRLELAATSPNIQGYADGVFWERNSSPKTPSTRRRGSTGDHGKPTTND